VVPGDRKNVILAILKRSKEEAFPFCGIVLSDDIKPKGLMEEINKSPLPVVSSPLDSYSIASRILSMKVKTLPGDTEKIARIQKLVSEYLNVPRILQRIGSPIHLPPDQCRACVSRNIDSRAWLASNRGP
jgi:BioD-like phosphotransacetylase family protein